MARRTNVLYELWRTSRRASAVLATALDGLPLDAGDFGLYSLLRFSGPVTPSEVARRSGMPATTTSQMLRRIEGRGHLRRDPNPDDARSVTVALTPAGEEAHGTTGEAFVVALQALHAELGDEVDVLIYSLARLDRALAILAGDEPDDFSPVRAPPDQASLHTLTYAGPALSPAEEDEARRFLTWLRYRRTAPVP